MSTDAQLPAQPSVDEQPRPGAPKRLPGLWVICVLLGLAAALDVALALSATALGAVIFGASAALDVAMAGVLWVRVRWGWYAVMAVLAIGFVVGLTASIAAHELDAVPTWLACFVFGFYLWKRRDCFLRAGAARRRILSGAGVSAMATVLLVGGGLIALLTVDDARRSSPELEVQVPTPPEAENGFVLEEQVRQRWKLAGDTQLFKVMDGMPAAGAAPAPEWLQEARQLVGRYAECLADARQLARKTHFVEPHRLRGVAAIEQGRPWLEHTRLLDKLLVIAAEVQAADGNWAAAQDSAAHAVQMGMLLMTDSRSLIQTLVGMAEIRIGLAGERALGAASSDATLLKAHLGPPVPEDAVIRAYNVGLASEFLMSMDAMADFQAGNYGSQDGGETRKRGLLERQIKRLPFIKMNMSYNLYGGFLTQCVVRGDTFAPHPPNPLEQATGLVGFVRSVGWLHFARDPVGDILVTMLFPVMERNRQVVFETIADARMTQIFLALRCYELEHGKLPDALDALAPEYLKAVPLDPFTGKAFGYEPGGQKPRVWSVGPDQKTDPLGTGPEATGDDVIVFLPFSMKEPGKTDGGE